MSSTELEEYLASEEELLLSFSPESIQDEDTDPDLFSINDNDPVFGATDRRILYSSGGFKDIEYSHISSIENQTKNRSRKSKRTDLHRDLWRHISSLRSGRFR